MSTDICKRAFKDSYFKAEKLSYVETQPGSGNECHRVNYTVWQEFNRTTVSFTMELKMCLTMKENADNVVTVVIITSNPQCNAELMQGCKENGMHAFGPLWDS